MEENHLFEENPHLFEINITSYSRLVTQSRTYIMLKSQFNKFYTFNVLSPRENTFSNYNNIKIGCLIILFTGISLLQYQWTYYSLNRFISDGQNFEPMDIYKEQKIINTSRPFLLVNLASI